jgi:hypothetical protein
MLDSVNSPAIQIGGETMSDSYHAISHHGRTPAKLREHEVADRDADACSTGSSAT